MALMKLAGSKALEHYDSGRDKVRDLSGFDNRIDQSSPKVPFTNTQVPFSNPGEAAFLSLMGEDKAYLGGDAINLIQSDPAMVAHEQYIIDSIKSDPRYMNESFTAFVPGPEGGVRFGGERAPYSMWDQAKAPWKPEYRATWEVAGNELTWLLRHANVVASVQVNMDGSFVIDYHLTDVLDSRPNRPAGDPYNYVTSVLGFLYHDIARGTEMEIEGDWKTTYP